MFAFAEAGDPILGKAELSRVVSESELPVCLAVSAATGDVFAPSK